MSHKNTTFLTRLSGIRLGVLVLIAVLNTGSVWSGEFQINQYTIGVGGQRATAISRGPSGSFVAAWQSYGQDGSNNGVFARRFDSSGGALGAEFQINQYTTSFQIRPAISHDFSGGFVMAWESYGQDGSHLSVFARRYDGSGNALGGEFQVNQYTSEFQRYPAISHASTGEFIVTWGSEDQDGSGGGVFARRYDGAGNALGPEFQVNQYTTNAQTLPAILHD